MVRKFGLFFTVSNSAVARGWTKRFCNAGLDENFLIKENAAEALFREHPNAEFVWELKRDFVKAP